VVLRQLDHVVLVVRDLDAAVADHRARGFTVTPGGVHAGGLTHNALVGFRDGSYLELIAFFDAAAAKGKHSWQPVAERGGGWADFALLCDDLAQEAKAVGDLVVRPPEEGGRTRPDGVAIAWRVARLVAPLPFLIEDVTARDLRVPTGDAAKHANGIGGVKRVIVGTRDPAALDARYAKLAARGAPQIGLRDAEREGIAEVIFA
jgi:glyoxalase-like protein